MVFASYLLISTLMRWPTHASATPTRPQREIEKQRDRDKETQTETERDIDVGGSQGGVTKTFRNKKDG